MLSGGVRASVAGSPSDVCAEVAELLGVSADTVDPGGNLISQGLDSIRMMSLAGRWRRRGIDVDFAALAADPTVEAWSLLVGVPHAVLPWEQPLGALPIARLGPPVRRHRLFPQGANANFVRFGGLHDFDIRTWERGVEAETLACGSGVLASVATGIFDGRLVLPVRARTRGGFVLTVGGEVEHNRVVRWTMAGDARVLSCAEVFAGAEVELAGPEW